jgi:GNAT superfamily N-acetyltransferase
MSDFTIRKAVAEDAELILRFITELAIYENAADQVVATAADLRRSLLGPDANAHALICQDRDLPIGYAVYFYNYSTWLGRNGMYIEDVYIAPEYRNGGGGTFLLRHLAGLAVQQGCGRLEWNVLDWNEPAIAFYQKIGAQPQSEWITYRLAGDDLLAFAGQS